MGDHDLARSLRRVFGRHDRIHAIGHRCARHDAYGCAGRNGAGERLAGHCLAEHAKRKRIVFAGACRLLAAERESVHRGPVEAGHVQWRNHVGRQDATGRAVDWNGFVAEADCMPVDPLQCDLNFASLREALHAHVTNVGRLSGHPAFYGIPWTLRPIRVRRAVTAKRQRLGRFLHVIFNGILPIVLYPSGFRSGAEHPCVRFVACFARWPWSASPRVRLREPMRRTLWSLPPPA